MSSIFRKIGRARLKRSTHDLTHERKMSLKVGKLYPVLCQEVVPGDKFNISYEMLMRLMPMVTPVMHRINVSIHTFFVPYRLIWENWPNYITSDKSGTEGDSHAHPYIHYSNYYMSNVFKEGNLSDFLGVPPLGPGEDQEYGINALPFAAYQKIWFDYYMDQNFNAYSKVNDDNFAKLSDGNNDATKGNEFWQIRTRNLEKDYFTSALPNAQKGLEVIIPDSGNTVNYYSVSQVKEFDGSPLPESTLLGANSAGTSLLGGMTASGSGGTTARIENIDSVDTNITVTNLRRAERLQQWLERNARAGTRYIEQILAHFDVRTPDYRLQRAEFLGGIKCPVVISEVLSSVQTETIPQGNMAGHGISVNKSGNVNGYFTEHGLIMSIMSIMPRTAYADVLPKMFLKCTDRFDYFWPEFEHIGEQEISNLEIYPKAGNFEPFGYTPRYAEYKFCHSTVHGKFRSNLDRWHLARKFSGLPPLNEAFLKADDTQFDRIFAVTDPNEDKYLVQLLNKVYATRPMSYLGEPRL